MPSTLEIAVQGFKNSKFCWEAHPQTTLEKEDYWPRADSLRASSPIGRAKQTTRERARACSRAFAFHDIPRMESLHAGYRSDTVGYSIQPCPSAGYFNFY